MKQRHLYKRLLALCLSLVMICGVLPPGILAAPAGEGQNGGLYPYQDPSCSFEERAADLVSRMTPEEKLAQLYNGRNPDAPAIPRLGVRTYRWWNEALHGVARDGVATSFPTGLGIAATWDRELVEQITNATGDEARDKFNSQENSHGLSYWSPTINMSRDPRWGRAEEAYGEDPYLTGEIAEAFVYGLQGAHDSLDPSGEYLKAIATPKHFLGNNSESNRHSGSSNIDERDLREYYTYAFKNAIENGKAESIMTSYNAVNGVPVSVSTELLDTLLRRTWGFDGYVTTDCDTLSDVVGSHKWRPAGWEQAAPWTRVEATAYALLAGVDANCGTTIGNNAKAAIDAGLISWDDVDKTLVRLFTARMKTGEFDPDGGPFGGIEDDIAKRTYQQLAEDSSDQAVVMLKNDGILPLGTTGTINSLVLVGDRADELELGDYSTYSPYGTSTALQGIQAAYERYCAKQGIEGSFQYIPGASSTSTGNYLMNVKTPQLCDADGNVTRTVDWNANSGITGCQVESAGNLGYMSKGENWVKFDKVDFTDIKTIKVDMAGDSNAARTTMEVRVGSPTGQIIGTMNQGAGNTGGWGSYQTYSFEFVGAGGGYDKELDDVYFVFFETKASNSGFTSEEEEAVKNADAVVFFAGTKQGENGYFENTDGYNLNLPNKQADLIEIVAGLNENTVVYMQAVSQINIEPFKDDVKGIFWSTYNGQAQGNAAGRLLFGERNPSAKLPFSWYTDINQLADVKDYQLRAGGANNGRTYQYFTGDVTYPFGYGLSYSNFEYSNLKLSQSSVTPNDTITVEFDVTNNSQTTGKEVAEVYVVSPNAAALDRPAKRLKGFDKKEIGANQTVHFSIELPVSDLWYWDAQNDVQTYDQGVYTIQVGSDSAACEKLTASFTLSGQLTKVLNVVTAAPSGHMLDTSTPNKTITTNLSACYNDQTFVALDSAEVTYTSSKPNVASVDENGVVTAAGGGIATITASVTVNGKTVTDSYPVVVNESVAATSITADGKILPGFDPEKTEYSVQVNSLESLPVIEATSAEGVTVTIDQAVPENPVAVVTLTKGEVTVRYTISFYQALQSFDFTQATEAQLKSTWSVIRENAENWTLDENGLTITTEKGDLYNNTNDARNMFYQETSGDWEVETSIVLDQVPGQNYQQVAMIAYQDDGNYLKLGYQGSGKKIEINYESGGKFLDRAPFSSPSMDVTTLWFRLKKEGSSYTGFYSTDGVTYTELGTQSLALSNVKIVLTANNGTQNPAPIKAAFKYFTVLSSSENIDFRNLTKLPDNWSLLNPTEGGLDFGKDGIVIHTTQKDGASATENQLRYDLVLTDRWTAETHFTISRPLAAKWEQFGMYVTNSAGDTLKVDVENGGSTNLQQFISPASGGTIHDSATVNMDGVTDIYLRLKYTGDAFELYYSIDGTQWSYLGSESTKGLDFGESTLQLYATSQRSPNASYDAAIEYCRISHDSRETAEYTITVADNDVCDVTYTVNPEGKRPGAVPDGGAITFKVTPHEGKVISAKTISVVGAFGQVSMASDTETDGAWIVTVSNVKGDITLAVNEAFGASCITVDGRAVKGFDPEVYSYTVNVTELPKTITATVNDGLDYTVEPAAEDDPVARVTVSKGSQTVVYTLNLVITPETTQASNPYLPLWEHIPDGEPHVFEDPDNPGRYRVYIYGSHDSSRTGYCGPEYVTWSAPVEDLTKWRYEGQIYSCADNGAGASTLFAPDVAYKDGTYYLYVHDWGHGQKIRVATSDRPDGPFTYVEGHNNAEMQNPGNSRVDFDPAVFVDDDGRAYAYWGASSRVTGFGSGELEADMKTIKEGTYTTANIDMDFSSSVGVQEGPFDFFEAASVRKVDGVYVLIYSQKVPKGTDDGVVNGDYRGRLAYAYSDDPLGPWTYGGVIIDNGGEIVVPGEQLSYDDGNNHGSIVEINGQWYVFYHRMTQGNETARQGMVEPIEIQVTTGEDGRKIVTIPQVEMTSQGVNTEGLDAYQKQDAGLACYLTGGAYITSGYRENADYNPIVNIKNGVTAGYKYLNFGTGALDGKTLKLALDLKTKGEAGTIEIYIDKPNTEEGTLIGVMPVLAGAGGYQTTEAVLSDVTGQHAVYLVFKSSGSGEICEINKLQFFNDGEIGTITGITLDKTSLMLAPNATETLTATVFPESAEDKTVLWSSSNEAVATVDQQGNVTAVSIGAAVITAAAGDKTATCSVKVRSLGLQSYDFTQAASKDKITAVWDIIRENPDMWTVDAEGSGLTITTEKGDLYTSTNTAKNMFYQEAEGDWLVETAVTLDQVPSLNYQQVAVIAYQDDDNYLKLGYQGFSSGSAKVEINSEANGSFGSASASEEYSGTDIWFRLQKAENTYTAWYSTDGETYVELGSKDMALDHVKIILTANNGTGTTEPIRTTFAYFKVLEQELPSIPVESVTLNKDTLELETGRSERLTASVEPDSATNQNVVWSTSNASVAAVDENGLVTAIAQGAAVITVTTEDGSKTAACEVTVKAAAVPEVPVERVTLNKTSLDLKVGNIERLTAVVSPDNAANKSVTWSSSNEAVATVRGGMVSAIAQGTATITATTVDGNKTASCTVTVRANSGGSSSGGGSTTPPVNVGDTDTPLAPPQVDTVFEDVKGGAWYTDAVQFVYEHNLMQGVGGGKFGLDMDTSRGMLVTILYRLEGSPKMGLSKFTDVPANKWYADAVAWASENNVVYGYDENHFGPEDPITREQLASILWRYVGSPAASGDLSRFSDAAQTSGYAQEAMRWAVENHIISGLGNGCLDPQGRATRAQAAQMLKSFIENLT